MNQPDATEPQTIEIEVSTAYVEDQSEPDDDRYVFATMS